MTKIEERAITTYPTWTDGGIITQSKREGYVRGATEQQKIDYSKDNINKIIDLYWDWMKKLKKNPDMELTPAEYIIEELNKKE